MDESMGRGRGMGFLRVCTHPPILFCRLLTPGVIAMTYQELLLVLQAMTKEQLEMDVTISRYEDYYSVNGVKFSDADDILNLGHPYLIVE